MAELIGSGEEVKKASEIEQRCAELQRALNSLQEAASSLNVKLYNVTSSKEDQKEEVTLDPTSGATCPLDGSMRCFIAQIKQVNRELQDLHNRIQA